MALLFSGDKHKRKAVSLHPTAHSASNSTNNASRLAAQPSLYIKVPLPLFPPPIPQLKTPKPPLNHFLSFYSHILETSTL